MMWRWEETRLWAELAGSSGDEAEAVRAGLGVVLPRVEGVLRSGTPAAKDFTLHDELHAFRVAELMVGVVPVEVLPLLSPFELGLLVLSAYLHDVGMSP